MKPKESRLDWRRSIYITGFLVGVLGQWACLPDGDGGGGAKVTAVGVLVAGFGDEGYVLSNPTSLDFLVNDILVTSTAIFVGGTVQTTAADYKWRVEKYLIASGALDTSFDGDGVLEVDPSGFVDELHAIGRTPSGTESRERGSASDALITLSYPS